MARRVRQGLAVVICVACIANSCAERSKEKARQQSLAEEKRAEESIAQLAVANSAITDWRRPFLSDGPVYSGQLESALVRRDGRPVVFIGHVLDVDRQDGQFHIYFLTSINVVVEVLFVVAATEGQATEVMAQGDYGVGSWAVAAQIDSVRSLAQQTVLLPGDETTSEPPQSAAMGQCLDLRYIGLYWVDPSKEP